MSAQWEAVGGCSLGEQMKNGLGCDVNETVLCWTSCFDTPFGRQHGAPAPPYGALRSLQVGRGVCEREKIASTNRIG